MTYELLTSFTANNGLEVSDNCWERVRTNGTANNIVRVAHVGNPVAHSFVDSIFQGLAATGDGNNGGAQQLHLEHVERLSFNIFGTHVDHTLETELGANCSCGDTVLTSTSLGNNTRLVQSLSEQCLTDCNGGK